jgi:hypothetical protein
MGFLTRPLVIPAKAGIQCGSLQALVSGHGEKERSLGDFSLEELYSFVGEDWEQEDDITLLTLRGSPSRS